MSNLTVRESASVPMTTEQVNILRRTLFKGFNDDEMAFSLAVCTRTGLDPFLRQVHFTKRRNNKAGDDSIVITTGLDGFRLIASRTGAYAGSDEPRFEIVGGKPLSASVTVWRIVQGVRCAFTATARWAEFYPGDGAPGFMWRKMPFVMLAKCAEAQALRKAFPAELSSIHSTDEMAQAGSGRAAITEKTEELTKQIQAAEDVPEFEAADYFEDVDPGDVVFAVGKELKGKRLKDIPDAKLNEFLEWANKQDQDTMDPEAVECAISVTEYLAKKGE